ncbi:MAG: hypothetical protein PHO56_02790 [Patescibacteria group bacterium]|nr:hypothetical protein [Patescibacteria group bacterium]
MRSQLERAIDIAKMTGDKIIVIDELNDRSSVVMNLDDYEKLLNGQNKGRNGIKNLTEEELLDKINHDIVSWKDANSEKKFFEEMAESDDDFDDDEEDSAFASLDEASADEDGIFPNFVPPHFDADVSAEALAKAEGNIIPDEEDDEMIDEPAAVAPVEPKADEDQNVYYYHEPSFAEAAEGKPDKSEVAHEETGFTSIKDELKNRKHWEIPEEVKKSAADVRF